MIGYVFLYVRVNLIISMYEVVIVVLVGMVIEKLLCLFDFVGLGSYLYWLFGGDKV